MRNYEKPVVLANNELFEGVFAASGAYQPQPTQPSQPSYNPPVYTQTNAWDGNKQYNVSFTNPTGEKVNSVSVTIPVNGTITGISGNATGKDNGDGTWTLTFNNYGNGIDANTTIPDIFVQVTGTGEFGFGN